MTRLLGRVRNRGGRVQMSDDSASRLWLYAIVLGCFVVILLQVETDWKCQRLVMPSCCLIEHSKAPFGAVPEAVLAGICIC